METESSQETPAEKVVNAIVAELDSVPAEAPLEAVLASLTEACDALGVVLGSSTLSAQASIPGMPREA